MTSLVGYVTPQEAHADSHEALFPLKDEDHSSRSLRSPDDARSSSLAFATSPLTLSVSERAFEVFRTPSTGSIDPAFITLHRLYSLL